MDIDEKSITPKLEFESIFTTFKDNFSLSDNFKYDQGLLKD